MTITHPCIYFHGWVVGKREKVKLPGDNASRIIKKELWFLLKTKPYDFFFNVWKEEFTVKAEKDLWMNPLLIFHILYAQLFHINKFSLISVLNEYVSSRYRENFMSFKENFPYLNFVLNWQSIKTNCRLVYKKTLRCHARAAIFPVPCKKFIHPPPPSRIFVSEYLGKSNKWF